ncbi:hypothetical protein DBR06_SOUSAS1810254, partial [Sousa chinensis]
SFPYSCSTLRRKIATLCDSFTTKSLNEHIFPPLMHMVIFFNFFKAPFLVDLKKPELKIPHTVSFYNKGEPRVILGTWHTVSSCRWGEDAKGKGRSCYEAALHDGNPIIVYLHGMQNTSQLPLLGSVRAAGAHLGEGGSRGELWVIHPDTGAWAMTPRSIALSPGYLSNLKKKGVRSDASSMLLFLFSSFQGFPVDAIILEAPFTNIWVASINYPLLKIYWKLPGFLSTVMDALRKDELVFPSDENVKFLSSPLLIIHGEDDKTVPLEFGKKAFESLSFCPLQLCEIAHNAYRNKERVKMVIFPPGLQHTFLCKGTTRLKTVR